MARDWTNQLPLMEWLCTPGDDLMGPGRGLRQHKTLTALAAHLGVTRDALYKWQEMPGFDEALGVVARRTFRKYEPGYVRTLIAQLHQPNKAGYERLVTAWVRYIEPAMQSPEAIEAEEAIIPQLTTAAQSKDNYETLVSERLRQLPTHEREIILNFHSQLEAEQSNEVLDEVPTTKRVSRMVSEAEEKEEFKADLPTNDRYIDLKPIQNLDKTDTKCISHTNLAIVSKPKLNTSTGKYRPKRKR